MTLPLERTRALLWSGSFLIELARDKRLPIDVRRTAVAIARHFPTIEDVSEMARIRHASGLGIGLADPRDIDWRRDYPQGPLRYATRLEWPEEDGDT